MSRKDTIIVALLINAGLLALLFMLAVNTDEESSNDYTGKLAFNEAVNEGRKSYSSPQKSNDPVNEEVDSFISELSSEDAPQSIVVDEQGYVAFVKDNSEISIPPSKPEVKETIAGDYVEVVVKRGDVLEKIAKNNGTTVEEIKKINGLNTTKLSIGQTLKVPAGKAASQKVSTAVASVDKKPTPPPAPVVAKSTAEPVYYTMKSGDTPWKIARENNVKFDELLKLNGLNEERARNLKPGDKLRVK